MSTMESRDRIVATFTPKATETLRPESLPFVGQRLSFWRGWEITTEDGGPYVGQVAWVRDGVSELGWVPSEDLTDWEPK